MKTFGFRVNNDAFEKSSWYFRNALVRANYNDLQKGIHSTTKYLEMFFSNLLLDTHYELKNRYMHIDYVDESNPQSVNPIVPKSQFDTLDCTHLRGAGNFRIDCKKSDCKTARTGRSYRKISQYRKANNEIPAG